MKSASYLRRRAVDAAAKGLAWLALAGALFFLGSLLWTLLVQGGTALSWRLLTDSTPSPGGAGGLANAVVGGLLINGLALAAAVPIGILAGAYLAEYGRYGRLAGTIRFLNDILLSVPSICIGLFVYAVVVEPQQHFSGLAGSAALAIVALPIVVRITVDMLALVPDTLREAAAALGAPPGKVIRSICLASARGGILTGALLATARIAGETAPLLFTSLNNQFWSLDMTAPMATMPATIYQFALSPYDDWHALAWAGALMVTATVLSMNVAARLLVGAPRKDP
jgi:phosphate transport system permease protein